MAGSPKRHRRLLEPGEADRWGHRFVVDRLEDRKGVRLEIRQERASPEGSWSGAGLVRLTPGELERIARAALPPKEEGDGSGDDRGAAEGGA